MTGTRSTASGQRAAAVGTNYGSIFTGDVQHLPPAALRTPAEVPMPAGLVLLPRPPTAPFLGRADVLRALASSLSATGTGDVTQAIHGLGGIGKSELALQYASGHRAAYPLIWWITADGPERLEAGLAELARCLHTTSVLLDTTTTDAARWATLWLQSHPGWLLVLDDVERRDDVAALLGRIGHAGHVVITTRRNVGWRGTAHPLALGVLDPASAAGLVSDLTGREDEAGALATDLGHLPLALEQASAYVAQQQIPIAAYRRLLASHSAHILGTADADGDPERTIARIWLVTLDAVDARHPRARTLLNTMAYFAPDDIPRDVLTAGDLDPVTVNEALGVLASYNMITLTDTTAGMHRLVQAVVRQHDPDGAGAEAALALLWAAKPDGDIQTVVTTWPRWRHQIPHIERVAAAIPDGSATMALAELLGGAGFYLWVQGRHDTALQYEQRALAITEAALGPDHPDVGTCVNNLASTLGDLGRPDEALPLRQRALTIAEAAPGPDHESVGTLLGNLAGTLNALGRPEEALPLHRRALTITEAALGAGHADVGVRLGNLAYTLNMLGRPEEALPLQRRALAVTEAALGPEHPDIGIRLDNLAGTLNDLGRPEEALPLQQRALVITETGLRPGHPDLGVCLDNLAATLSKLGRVDEALLLRQRALAITEAALGPGHPSVGVRLSNLGHTLHALGRTSEAIALFGQALAITEAALGPDHPTTGSRRRSLQWISDGGTA